MAGTNGHHHPPAEIPPLPFDLNSEPRPSSISIDTPPAPSTIVDERAQASGAEYGEILSPSQVNTFLDCPARWYFKYVQELPDPKSGALSLGSAFHAALKAHYQHKLVTQTDLPVPDAIAAYQLAWSELQDRTVYTDKEDPAALGEMGEALVRTYLEQAAPAIVPVLLEQHLTGVIGGVKAQGYVDLVDRRGVIRDTKSAAKSPNGVSAGHALQVTTYSMLLSQSGSEAGKFHTGECSIDTVTKTKTVKYVPQTFHVGPRERQLAENLFPMVQDGIRAGIYTPHRDSHLCSRHHCSFWRACEKEFGGTVGE